MPPGYIMRRWVTSSVLRYEDGGVDKYKPASSGLPIEAFGNDGLLAVSKCIFRSKLRGSDPKRLNVKRAFPRYFTARFRKAR